MRRLALCTLLLAAPPARAQRLPADTLHALVGRMRAHALVTDSVAARLHARVDSGRITLRSTLVAEQRRARYLALTGTTGELPFGRPMMGFDGTSGETQAEWLARFVRAGLLTRRDSLAMFRWIELTPMPGRTPSPATPEAALDSMLRARSPVPMFEDLVEGAARLRELHHPDRLRPWADTLVAHGLATPQTRARLLDTAAARPLLPSELARVFAHRLDVPPDPQRTAEDVAGLYRGLARWLAADGRLPRGFVRGVRFETTTAPGWDSTRVAVRTVFLLDTPRRVYRSDPWVEMALRTDPSPSYEPGPSERNALTEVFNRMLNDRGAPEALFFLGDERPGAGGTVVQMDSAGFGALVRYRPPEFRRVMELARACPDRACRDGLMQQDEAEVLLSWPFENWAWRAWPALRTSDALDALADRLDRAGWFAGAPAPRTALFETSIPDASSLYRALVGQDGRGDLTFEDAEHASPTPYGDVLRALARLSRGTFVPSSIGDDFAAERADADTTRGTVRWTAAGRAFAVRFDPRTGDHYDTDAVRQIVRHVNTTVRGGRFWWATKAYAVVFVPDPAKAVLEAEGIRLEAP